MIKFENLSTEMKFMSHLEHSGRGICVALINTGFLVG